MNYYRFHKPLRQFAAVALLLLAIAAVVSVTVVPLQLTIADLQERIEQERETLSRFGAVERDEALRRELDRRTQAVRANGLFLDGESESIRMASLQSLVTEIAAASGIKPRSIRNLPARERNQLRLLGVQLQFSAPIEPLRRLLFAIEEQRRVLLIDSLQISPLPGAWLGNDEQRGMLDVRFDVFGVEARQK